MSPMHRGRWLLPWVAQVWKVPAGRLQGRLRAAGLCLAGGVGVRGEPGPRHKAGNSLRGEM